MEFLVRIEIALPASMSEGERDRLRAAEGERARHLIETGILERIWRIPGATANWSLYNVHDEGHLDAVLSSLPLRPWITAEIHPLSQHPSSPISARQREDS